MLHRALPFRAASIRLSPALCRNNSTATTTPTATTTATSASSTTMSAQPPHGKLDWDTFLKLRKLRRRYNLASSVFTSTLGTVAGVGYLANKEIDPTQMIMGMDPIVLFGLATVSCGALGWLAGPMFGSSAFAVVKRKLMPQINEREREFLQHIKKNRVDPSFQSFSNPVPDYYGEKIGSIQQYKQWLKDQRAYNRKSKNFL